MLYDNNGVSIKMYTLTYHQFKDKIHTTTDCLINNQAPDQEVEDALEQALEAGYRHIDAAPAYRNEPAIGRVLKRWLDSGRVKREDLFIVTKLPPSGNRASDVEERLSSSLNSLQLEYVDVYLIHMPFALYSTPSGDFRRHENGDVVSDLESSHVETWKVRTHEVLIIFTTIIIIVLKQKMEEMVTKGLTKSIGVSNFNKSQVERLVQSGTIKPANLQIEMHIYLQQIELVKFCKENNIIVTAYAPLGSKGISALHKMVGIE